MYATVRATDRNGMLLDDNLFWTGCACRATGDDQFSEEDRDWFGLCFFGLAPLLHEVYRSTENVESGQLSALPMRLRRVVGCFMNGDTEKEAVAKLGLSPHTVHGYVKELYTNFEVRSKSELIIKLLK